MRHLLAILAILAAVPAHAQTLDQMAGQMIVVGFQGDDVSDAAVEALAGEIGRGEIGGVMYLKTNVKTLGDVSEMNSQFLAASPDLPPFLTLDQEGGAVERLTGDVGFAEVPTARQVASGTAEEAEALYGDMAQGIAELGFTVNFGPVVDLDLNPDNQIIAKFGRSFGASPDDVVPYAEAFVRAHRAAGLLTSLKHFPGHGSSTADSHEGFVDITDTWQPEELQPYHTMIGDGLADMVMVGHLINSNVETDGLPSSLSPEWIEDVLRTELGFEGLVITDDLEMGAIREHFDLEETVVRAISAGVDVLLFSNTADYRPGLADEVRAILVAKAEADPVFRARIEESYGRIVALKGRIGQ